MKIKSALLMSWIYMMSLACTNDDSNANGTEGKNESNPDSESVDDHKDEICDVADVSQIQACVEQKRYIADLESVAVLRPPGSEGWHDVQDMLAQRLEQLGYDVSRSDYGSGVNVIGRLPGTKAEEIEVILSAHYDHIPGCPGADDNASGRSDERRVGKSV